MSPRRRGAQGTAPTKASLSSTFVTVVNAGSNLSTARPAGASVVLWRFSAGVNVGTSGANIVNRVAGDLYWVAG